MVTSFAEWELDEPGYLQPADGDYWRVLQYVLKPKLSFESTVFRQCRKTNIPLTTTLEGDEICTSSVDECLTSGKTLHDTSAIDHRMTF